VPKYYYYEPVAGDINRFPVLFEAGDCLYIGNKKAPIKVPLSLKQEDGSFEIPDGGGRLYPETQEWLDRYQVSLHAKVATDACFVYYVYTLSKGKRSSKAMVVDDDGASYIARIPTMPPPERGDRFTVMREDLVPVSLTPNRELVYQVRLGKQKAGEK
jgi:hypothetical protein